MTGRSPAGAPGSDRLLVGTVFLTFATAVANTTAGAIAQPEIADAFGAGPGDVGAIVYGYSTTFAIMTLAYGSLARRFGLGRCLTLGVVLIALGAAIAVVAVDLPMLVFARALQGFGAGAIPTLSMALISRRLAGLARARALGVNVAAVGIGFAAGPLFGGLLLEAFGWRGTMALGLLVAPTALLYPRLAPEPGDPRARVDVPGIVLLATAVGGVVIVLNRLPVLGRADLVIALAAVTLAAWLAVVAWSRRRAEPALPIRELDEPILRRAMLLGSIGQTAFFGVLVLAPIIGARVHGIGGFRLGLLLLPMAALIALVSPHNGRVADRIGRRATTAVSLTTIALGAAFLAAQGPASPIVTLELGLLVAGGGFGLLSAPLAAEVSRHFDDARRSLALGAYNLAFFLGSASGGAISTGFVQARLEIGPFAGRELPGASTGLLVLALLPLLALAFDRLRPIELRRPLGAID